MNLKTQIEKHVEKHVRKASVLTKEERIEIGARVAYETFTGCIFGKPPTVASKRSSGETGPPSQIAGNAFHQLTETAKNTWRQVAKAVLYVS